MELPLRYIEALLDTKPVARIAAADRQGEIQLLSVPIVRLAPHLYFWTDERPRAVAQRDAVETLALFSVSALTEPARCTVLIDGWSRAGQLRYWLRMSGEIEVMRSGVPADLRAAFDQRCGHRFGNHALCVQPGAATSDDLILSRILPRRIESWCPGPALPTDLHPD